MTVLKAVKAGGVDPEVTEELPHIDPQDFKDVMGRYRTESLFLETKRNNKYDSYFTLAHEDKKGHLSMRRKYLEISDPTEYQVAMQLLGDYKHWQALASRKWFKDHLDQWRIELDDKLQSEAVATLREIARSTKAGGRVQAARLLLDKPWEAKNRLRGRPSNDEVEGYRKQASDEAEESHEDYLRVFGKDTK